MSTPLGVGARSRRPRSYRACRIGLAGLLAAFAPLCETVAALLCRPHRAPIARASAALSCVGDCDDDADVSREELRLGIEIGLRRVAVDQCLPFDPGEDGSVTVDDLVLAVRARREGCERLPCRAATIDHNQRLLGLLAAGDCTAGSLAGNYADLYRFTGAAGDLVAIRLSASFDAYLVLTLPGGERIISDNCPGDGLNSCIPEDAPFGGLLRLPADGEYLIEATSFSLAASGGYALLLAVQTEPTLSPTSSPSRTPTAAVTSTLTATPTASRTATAPLPSPTPGLSATITATASRTPTAAASSTPSATHTPGLTPTRTPTPSATHTPASTATFTRSPTVTRTATPTRTATSTRTHTQPASPTPTRTLTRTATQTRTPTRTRTPTGTFTPTPFSPLIVEGRCRRPGPAGLVPCDEGFSVNVWRCDERPTCLEPIALKTLLGQGPIGAQGAFSVVINDLALGDRTMLVEAEAALQPATIYRILDIGSLGGGGGGRAAGGAARMLEIDPSSEGAMRSLDADTNPLGLDAFSNGDIQKLVELTRSNAGTYAGLSADQAAEAGREISAGLSTPRLLSFVAASGGTTYHVLSAGAFDYHFTTLVATTFGTVRACSSSSDVLTAAVAATFLPSANLVTRSPLLEGQRVVFNPAANGAFGRVCVGSGCQPDASCPPGASDCQLFAQNQNATPLSLASPGVPAAQTAFVPSNALCVLDGNAFALGTSEPTTQVEIESDVPGDGFTLPASTTIAFSQPTSPGGGYLFGFGAFRLRGGGALSGAAANLQQGSIPGFPVE